MTDNLTSSLRELAEWAHGNEWETPITLGDHLDAAADALVKEVRRLREEKQEREKGCEYCADHEDLAFGHDSMKRVGSIYIDGNLLVADLYSESMAVAVCFCPMCGKPLKEETHD